MPEIPDSIALIIIYGLMRIIEKGLTMFAGWRSDDAHADELSAAREEQWMRMVQTMLDSTLSAQHTRYAEFVQQVQAGFEKVTANIQASFTAALTELVDQMSIRMSAVTDQRNAKLDTIHADVRAVPGRVKTDTDVQFDAVRIAVAQTVRELSDDLKREINDLKETRLTIAQVEGVIDRTLMHRLVDLSAKLDRVAGMPAPDTTSGAPGVTEGAAAPLTGEGTDDQTMKRDG